MSLDSRHLASLLFVSPYPPHSTATAAKELRGTEVEWPAATSGPLQFLEEALERKSAQIVVVPFSLYFG